MSMYALAFGVSPEIGQARMTLAAGILGLVEGDDALALLGRFRDCWIEKQPDGPPRLAVYTRNGGGNRADYADEIARMQAHPLYLHDADDGFDATYATFYFEIPADCPSPLLEPWDECRKALADAAVDQVDTDQRWYDAIDSVRGG